MIDPASVSSLTLAYLGDSYYELQLRRISIGRHSGSTNDVNRYAKEFSSAKAQAEIAELLAEYLSEDEMHIYKRGRNAKSVSAPHTCTISEYRRATGLEALMGYLYLAGREERAQELIQKGIDLYEAANT